MLACYALAKALELADHGIFAAGGLVGGHALKHLAAAAAALVLLGMLRRRISRVGAPAGLAHGPAPCRR